MVGLQKYDYLFKVKKKVQVLLDDLLLELGDLSIPFFKEIFVEVEVFCN